MKLSLYSTGLSRIKASGILIQQTKILFIIFMKLLQKRSSTVHMFTRQAAVLSVATNRLQK
jgi:hypothetical protein